MPHDAIKPPPPPAPPRRALDQLATLANAHLHELIQTRATLALYRAAMVAAAETLERNVGHPRDLLRERIQAARQLRALLRGE
jgi:hypothetical protein